MQLIIGLGNPGAQYEQTRHNAGFLVLDHIADTMQVIFGEPKQDSKFNAALKLFSDANKTILLYPQTFMNESGTAVKAAMDFYKLAPKDILVLHDEIDLPLGTFRFTESSSAAGHNGVKSIIETLGTQDFRRIRIGVETRTDKNQPPTDAFVLQKFQNGELEKIPLREITNKAFETMRIQ